MSSPDSLPQQHLPGRSSTKPAWGALVVLVLLIALWIFHPIILRCSLRTLLWAARPLTGITIKEQKLKVAFGEPLCWEKASITFGKAPHQSHVTLKKLSLSLTSPWRILFGDHLLVTNIKATEGKGILDLQTTEDEKQKHFLEIPTKKIAVLVGKKMIPESVDLNNISLIITGNEKRIDIKNFYCLLSKKIAGNLSYDGLAIETKNASCHLPEGSCETLWDGKKVSLKNLPLSEEIMLQDLELAPQADHLDFGLTVAVFEGLMRADGSISQKANDYFIAGTVLGEKLSLDRLSKLLGLTQKISGKLREGRITFHGSLLHFIDADASLRLIADNFRWKKRGWAALSIVANLIGRKISLTHFQLTQNDNHVTASGDVTLPTDWHKIAQAPFLLKIKAAISDASQLADLMGSPWNKITGRLFVDGEIKGAENQATGYLNTQGSSMTAYDLPIDSLKLQLLFQGNKTTLTNFDLWSESNRLQLSGNIENAWPHHYEGKASLNSNNLAQKLSLLGMSEMNFMHHGILAGSWTGSGTASNHSGSFDFSLRELRSGSEAINGHCSGAYTPGKLRLSKLNLNENNSSLSALVEAGTHGITISNIKLSHDDTAVLSGNIFLPINALSLLQGETWTHTVMLGTPLNVDVTLHDLQPETFFAHFSPQLNEIINHKIHQWLSSVCPPFLHIEQSLLSGALAIHGLFYEPKFSGHLDLHAEKLLLGTFLTPLTKAHGTLLLSPDKITLNDASAFMGTGKVNVIGSSQVSFWKKLKHLYHITGDQLTFYQTPTIDIEGNAHLALTGDADQGILQGNLDLTKIVTPTHLSVTPFLIPPGIIFGKENFSSSKGQQSAWTTDIAINNSAEKTTPFGKSTLHLTGDLFSPVLEGSLSIQHFPIIFPQKKFSQSKGSLTFNQEEPWIPQLNLTATGLLDGKKITAQLSTKQNQHTITFQSNQDILQETIAMKLALPSDPQESTPGWIDEITYCVRQEELEIKPPTKSPFVTIPQCLQVSEPTDSSDLGFGSHSISFWSIL